MKLKDRNTIEKVFQFKTGQDTLKKTVDTSFLLQFRLSL